MTTIIANRVRADDSEVEADVQDDQLHKASGIHQCAERGRVAPTQAGQPGSDERTAELADGRRQNDRRTRAPDMDPCPLRGRKTLAGTGYGCVPRR